MANQLVCAFCFQSFKVTKTNTEAHTHVDTKHPKNTFEECYPVKEIEETKDEYLGYDNYDDVADEPKVTCQYKCVFSNNIMTDDFFETTEVNDGALLEIRTRKYPTQKCDNLAALHSLKKAALDKPAFMEYIKGYCRRVCGYLKENDKADRIKPFQAAATEYVKFVASQFGEFTFYWGESEDKTAALVARYVKPDDDMATFVFLLDGLQEIEI
jgi:hypothetical protein